MTEISEDFLLLKSRIRLFVALFIVAVMSLMVWHVLSERRSLLSAAEIQSQGHARALGEYAGSVFAEADHALRDLVVHVGHEGGIDTTPRETLYQLLKQEVADIPQIGSLFLVNRSGLMVVNSEEFSSRQIDVADREYFKYNAMTPNPGRFISRPLVSRLVNRWRFTMTRPIFGAEGEFAGFAGAALEIEYFHRFYTSLNLGPRSTIQLIRADGAQLVAEPVPAGSTSSSTPSDLFRKNLDASRTGTFRDSPASGDSGPFIVSFVHLPRLPVVAVVALHQDEILRSWKRKSAYEAGSTIGLCVAIILLAQLLQRHLVGLHLTKVSLREQQEQVRLKAAQIDAATDAIILVDTDGRLRHYNNALCKMTGFDVKELQGALLHDLEPPDFAERIAKNIRLLQDQGTAIFESAFLTRSGQVLPVEVNARTMETEGATFILSIVRDITDRKRTELKERTRLQLLEEVATGLELQKLLPHIVSFVEQEQKGALCSIMLADESERQLHTAAAPSLPDFYNRATDGLKIAEGMGSCGTAAFRRQRVIVEDIQGHPFWKGFKPAAEAGLRACWSEPVISSQGELLGTFAIYHREIRSPDAAEIDLIESAAHLVAIAIERVRSEEQKGQLEAQLHHVQKIEAIGQLAGGIAHDFNNLLTPIIGYAYILQKKIPDQDPLMGKVDGIMSAAYKARDLTQQLLSFGRKQRLEMKRVDLNEIVREFEDMLQRTIRENISIHVRLSPASIPIRADRGQIEQILLNLAVNAQDAIAGNGVITVETGHVVLDDEYTRLHPGVQPGPYALLTFSDNGCGMDDETLSHIFEPFFTTKQFGHGTGLGLATVYGIIKQHEGHVAVKTRRGDGTTFSLYLPFSREADDSSTALPDVAQGFVDKVNLRSVTTLVVEDNDMVRAMTVELLESAGYSVLAADRPSVALEMVQQHGDRISILVSDVVMPEMSGVELYERVLVTLPGLKVLFISGYTHERFVHSGTLEEGVNFLQKPFAAEAFLAQIQRIAGQHAID